MASDSSIQWTDHTFNPWWGCSRVSEGCQHCYAEGHADRRLRRVKWGPKQPRLPVSDETWRHPRSWDRAAARAGRRTKVFCASMADVFDQEAPRAWRGRLWQLIRQTPNLEWQVLTKRPEHFAADLPWLAQYDGLPPPDGVPWGNVWLGVSVETARWYERIDALCEVPAAVRFLSCEPLLGALDLRPWLGGSANRRDDRVDWVIVGGESGGGARPAEVEWARGVVGQCRADGVPVFVKQLGARPLEGGIALQLADRKGGDLEEWPPDLRVREFPRARVGVLQPLQGAQTR